MTTNFRGSNGRELVKVKGEKLPAPFSLVLLEGRPDEKPVADEKTNKQLFLM